MYKRLFLLFPVVLVIFIVSANSRTAVTAVSAINDTPRMKQYWLVTLLKGPNRTQDKETADKIQEGHLANIGRLAKGGHIVIAGPMGYDRELRGIFIMDAKDSVTVASLVNTDPAVQAGRLRFEIHPWWTQTGTYILK